MWGRYEGKILYGIAIFVAILFYCPRAISQELPPAVVKIIEMQSASGAENIEALYEHFMNLLENPLELNDASENDLRKSRLFNEFQIKSILDYRKSYGRIVSFYELSLVDGFSLAKLEDIKGLIILDKTQANYQKCSKVPKFEIILKSRKTFNKSTREFEYLPSSMPFYGYIRYKMLSQSRIQVGFTMENDDGEKLYPDFLSAYIQLKDVKLSSNKKHSISSLIFGDYSVRMGQGLVAWNSFSMASYGEPSSIIRMENEPSPYTSSDEQNFFRGIAISFQSNSRWHYGAMLSSKLLDAKVISNSFFSLPSGGLHNTQLSLNSKDRLQEDFGAFYLNYSGNTFKLSLNTALYGYDKKDERPYRDYSKFQKLEGLGMNTSLSFIYSNQGRRYFLEAATDKSADLAFITGVVLPLGSTKYPIFSDFELSFMARYYQKGYFAPFAGAYCVNSDVANEHGALFNLKWAFSKDWLMRFSTDFSYHPWYRYQLPLKSKQLRVLNEFSYSFSRYSNMDFRISYKWRNYDSQNKVNLRLNYSLLPKGNGFSFNSRIEASGSRSIENKSKPLVSMGIYQDVGYVYLKNGAILKKLSSYFRVTLFHVDDWSNRIYFYEKDLPYSYSVPALYGRGLSMYLVFKIRLLSSFDLGIKISQTLVLSDRQKDNTKLKLQIKYVF